MPRFNKLHVAAVLQWRTDYRVKEGDWEPGRRQLAIIDGQECWL